MNKRLKIIKAYQANLSPERKTGALSPARAFGRNRCTSCLGSSCVCEVSRKVDSASFAAFLDHAKKSG